MSDEADVGQIDDALTRLFRLGLPRIRARLMTRMVPRLDFTAYEVLAMIERHAPIRVSEIAHVVGVDASTVSRHACRLEQLDLVVRAQDAGDRRVALFALSPEGERLLREQAVLRRGELRDLLAAWTGEDVRELATLMCRFTSHLEEGPGETLP